jgi:hypothetical protein
MKQFFVFIAVIFSLSFSSLTFAQEADRSVNPGEDPNLAMTSQGADVAAHGTGCKECLARLKGGRLQDSTSAARLGVGGSRTNDSKEPGKSKANGGVE